jgi:hypothetical protein
MVKTDGLGNLKFQMGGIGKTYKGTWTVDATKAKFMDKANKVVNFADILPGSNVSVFGKINMAGKTIMADRVQVNYIPKRKAGTAAATPPKPTKAPRAPKPTPAANPGR